MAADSRSERPLVVGISGSMRFGTANEQALRVALDRIDELGGRTQMIVGSRLILPNFDDETEPEDKARWLLEAVEEADGIVLSSPSYHGGMTGLLKNGLDYLELLAGRPRPYLRDLPVGTIATGDGWQGPNSTLLALRQTVHALQGWPTPLGVAQNLSDGGIGDARPHLRTMAEQLWRFIEARRALTHRAAPTP
ncbi:MAG: NAD(P)H-dependent oxidoreductase [Solirubrobacteraceae bacterium]|nr:NAD(P)H-dependent oxidoreductase [Solirubrobacteraceae bacterium]